jgi:uncharacterized membrane protein required for colicin V production
MKKIVIACLGAAVGIGFLTVVATLMHERDEVKDALAYQESVKDLVKEDDGVCEFQP